MAGSVGDRQRGWRSARIAGSAGSQCRNSIHDLHPAFAIASNGRHATRARPTEALHTNTRRVRTQRHTLRRTVSQ